MNQKKESSKNNKKIHETLWDDIKQGGFKRTLRQDFKDIYTFYLDAESRVRLSKMKRVRRFFHQMYWLLRNLIVKLPPVRRILLILSLIFVVWTPKTGTGDLQVFAYLAYIILLIVLMLELKDKLLAQDELAVGRAVQSALMPKDNPDLEGWEIWLFTQSANEVGGDLVDYLFIEDTRLGLAIGDVAGKGLGAALLTAKLQSTIRAIATHYRSLSDFGSELNRIFIRDGLPQRFVSLVYLELEAGSKKIRLMNAGHPPPVHIQKGKIKEMAQGEPALGIMPKTAYKEHSIRLEKGDFLVVYSDGVTEARNEQGDFYGEKRWLQLLQKSKNLSAQALGEKMMSEIRSFVGEARPSDDLSLILLKHTG
jgi:sigma-B regulation protein RsbU (phosphoserine phosphatase)